MPAAGPSLDFEGFPSLADIEVAANNAYVTGQKLCVFELLAHVCTKCPSRVREFLWESDWAVAKGFCTHGDDAPVPIPNIMNLQQRKVVLDFWKEFDLDGRRLQLDKQGLELQDAKDASLARRKHLSELTKEFRKKSDAEKASGLQRLLKAYQEEIDALNKRCRASDSAFFSLYKSLYEAPDPAQALERSASEGPRVAASELEVQKLQAELAEYEEEFSKLKNQDITIRRLEGVIAGYEEGVEAKVAEEAAARAKEVQEEAEARMEAAKDQEAQLEKRLQTSEKSLAEAREAVERMEASSFESSRRAQEAEAAWEVEREILSQSNEASQAQLVRLEQELQEFRRLQISGVSGATQSAATASPLAGSTAGLTAPRSGLSHAEAVEAELAELTRVNAQLRGEVAAKSAVWREERESLEAQARSAREAAAGEMDAATAIRRELAARPTMEEVRSLRQQLRVLQQLEFNAGDEEDEGDGAKHSVTAIGADEPHGADPEDTASHVERTMEQVIRGRVRRLEADLTSSRRLAEERGAEAGRLRGSLDAAVALAAERLEVVNRLEDDLAASSSFRPGASGAASVGTSGVGVGGAAARDGGEGDGGLSSTQALRELLGVAEEGGVGSRGAVATGRAAMMVSEAEGGVLGIVQAQRDRFRRRIKELEAEREEEQREARGNQVVMERLQRDNLQLYEKVRFLQSYEYQRGSTSRSGGDGSNDVENGKLGGVAEASRRGGEETSSPTEARYGSMYEARINPFTQFSQRERQRKYRELTVAEKITLSTTRMFLSNKNFVFFYVVLLHLVVFFTLNYWTHSTNWNCAAQVASDPDPV